MKVDRSFSIFSWIAGESLGRSSIPEDRVGPTAGVFG